MCTKFTYIKKLLHLYYVLKEVVVLKWYCKLIRHTNGALQKQGTSFTKPNTNETLQNIKRHMEVKKSKLYLKLQHASLDSTGLESSTGLCIILYGHYFQFCRKTYSSSSQILSPLSGSAAYAILTILQSHAAVVY